jgi:hypothetical protein
MVRGCSLEETAELARRYLAGESFDDLEHKFSRSAKTIRKILVSAGVTIRGRGGLRRGQYQRRTLFRNGVRERNGGRVPDGYDLMTEQARLAERLAQLEAVEAATSLPTWLLSLPASARPIDPYPVG